MTPLIKRKQGGQTVYTDELADSICQAIAKGHSLNAICSQPGMPTEGAVRWWVTDNRSGFAARYAHARSMGVDALAEQCIDIADDRVADPDANSRRVRVDARKWFASKMRPDKYGDRSQVEMTGAGGQPLSVEISFVSPSAGATAPAATVRPVRQIKSADAT